MAIRNNHWYNLNEQHYYPLDDTASAISDAGELLPSALIADLRLRWPITYGKYAFISAAAVTPYLVTVLIEATNDLDNNPSSSTLIAGVTLPKTSLTVGRTYTLTPFQPGVGGYIVIGSGIAQVYSGKFSTPRQGLLTPRAARASRRPPVPTIAIENAANALKNLVNLVAVPPLYLTTETRVIDGVTYDNVIVFRLSQDDTSPLTTATTDSIFAQFAGPCGRRVGSNSCPDPQPIQTINGVAADCEGVITLDFRGCALVGRNTIDCGVVIDCELGLSASCNPPYLPNLTTGELPSESPPIVITPPVPPQPPIVPDFSISESVTTLLALPYCDTFDDATAHGFSALGDSLFAFISDDSPAELFCCDGPPPASLEFQYGCQDVSISVSESVSESVSMSNSMVVDHYLVKYKVKVPEVASSYGTIIPDAQSRTNISLFTSDAQSLYRVFTTDVKIVAGQTGSYKNAGLILNYQLNSFGAPNYVLALLDLDTSIFGVYFFNGLNLLSLSSVAVTGVKVDDWYRIQLSAVPDPATYTSVKLTAVLTGVTNPGISATINTYLASSLWNTDAANSGFYARRSKSYFSYWRIDEVTP